MATLTSTQEQSEVTTLSPMREVAQSALKGALAVERMNNMIAQERKDDARKLRDFANDPNKTHVEKFFMCNIVTRNKMFGYITQEQVDTLTDFELANLIEGAE